MNLDTAVFVAKAVSNFSVSMGTGAIVKGAADLAKPANVGKLRHVKHFSHGAASWALSSLVAAHAVAHADKKIDEYAETAKTAAKYGAKFKDVVTAANEKSATPTETAKTVLRDVTNKGE